MTTKTSAAPWTLFVIQHSHIDIGFTDRQEAIAGHHRDFIAQAVALATSAAQARRPEAARFKFTCEGFWAVEQYLRGATPAAVSALRAAFASGCLELTALRFHLSELLDAGHLRDTLAPARDFAREHGVPLDGAMSCDINGLPWALLDHLAAGGVRYLSVNLNAHHGGYPLGGPLQPFWWESPQGRRVLVWNGLAYHRANFLGLMGGTVPDGRIGIPAVDRQRPDAAIDGMGREVEVRDISFAERRIFELVTSLEQSGYPRRFLPVTGSGICTDNSPPSDTYCRLIAEWNTKHGDRVHIRTATLREFFAHLEAHEPDCPVHRGDWPDWWSDGLASSPRDVLLFRQAQRTKRLLERLDPGAIIVPPGERTALSASLALFAEHTFGHSETFSGSLLTQQVFARKSMLAAQADEAVNGAYDRVRTALGEGQVRADRPFRYSVVNPLAAPQTAVASLPLDWWESTAVQAGFTVRDEQGHARPHQLEKIARGWWVHVVVTLPASGRMELGLDCSSRAAPPTSAEAPDGAGFANAHYTVAFDARRGLTSLRDVTTDTELIEAGSGPGLGAPVWQHFPGGDRGAAGGYLLAPRTIPPSAIHHGQLVTRRCTADGSVFREWELDYAVPGTHRYTLQVRCHHALPHLTLTAKVHKVATRDPEGLYVNFPFAVPGGTWHLDRAGGSVRPGRDQLPGSCCDYYAVLDGAACCGPNTGVAWTTLDAPLVMLGRLRLWEYGTTIEPHGPLYSWIANNKWECNYPISIADNCEFRYLIETGRGLSTATRAIEAVQQAAVPLVVLRH
jgi:Glycosyl hydrolases family 38 N-terminal domain